MLNQRKIVKTVDDLVGQRYNSLWSTTRCLNRGNEQARHLLLDKRAEMRRLMGRKHRV